MKTRRRQDVAADLETRVDRRQDVAADLETRVDRRQDVAADLETRVDRRQDVAADLETRVDRIHASPTRPPPGRIEKMKREDEDTTRDVIRAGMNDAEGNQPRRGPHGGQSDGKARASDEEKGALTLLPQVLLLATRRAALLHKSIMTSSAFIFPRSGSHGTHA